MAIKMEKLIDLLNMDLELEYAAAIQYINHAAVMTGAAYGDITKELKIHANEEISHAMILSDQINYRVFLKKYIYNLSAHHAPFFQFAALYPLLHLKA